MPGAAGDKDVEVEVTEVIEVGGDRLKTLADAGLEYLGLVVRWAERELERSMRPAEDVDPLDASTPKQTVDAARTGVVAAVELAARKYPKLTQNRNESVDYTEVARRLLERGDITPEDAEKRLVELGRKMLPNGARVRSKVLAGAVKAQEGVKDG